MPLSRNVSEILSLTKMYKRSPDPQHAIFFYRIPPRRLTLAVISLHTKYGQRMY